MPYLYEHLLAKPINSLFLVEINYGSIEPFLAEEIFYSSLSQVNVMNPKPALRWGMHGGGGGICFFGSSCKGPYCILIIMHRMEFQYFIAHSDGKRL